MANLFQFLLILLIFIQIQAILLSKETQPNFFMVCPLFSFIVLTVITYTCISLRTNVQCFFWCNKTRYTLTYIVPLIFYVKIKSPIAVNIYDIINQWAAKNASSKRIQDWQFFKILKLLVTVGVEHFVYCRNRQR